MKRLVFAVMLAAAVIVSVRKISPKLAPAMRSRCAETCERMLASMPESFPPNRMMADLEALKVQTARIVELVDRPTDDVDKSSSASREPSVSGPRR